MKTATSVVGTGLLSLAAHIPCCGPTLLLAMGGTVGGAAWIHILEPYRLWFAGLSVVSLAYGFWAAYRTPNACHTCGTCESEVHAARRVRIGMMWFMAAFVSISLGVTIADVAQNGLAHAH